MANILLLLYWPQQPQLLIRGCHGWIEEKRFGQIPQFTVQFVRIFLSLFFIPLPRQSILPLLLLMPLARLKVPLFVPPFCPASDFVMVNWPICLEKKAFDPLGRQPHGLRTRHSNRKDTWTVVNVKCSCSGQEGWTQVPELLLLLLLTLLLATNIIFLLRNSVEMSLLGRILLSVRAASLAYYLSGFSW